MFAALGAQQDARHLAATVGQPPGLDVDREALAERGEHLGHELGDAVGREREAVAEALELAAVEPARAECAEFAPAAHHAVAQVLVDRGVAQQLEHEAGVAVAQARAEPGGVAPRG